MDFESWRSYWHFSQEIRRNRRYVRTPKSDAFLRTVAETCKSRLSDVPSGRIFWRAQLGHGWEHEPQIDDEIPCPFPPGRMIPLSDRAHEGRANPKGIPFLYVATTRDTAMSEVRPWIGAHVSVAQLRTLRKLSIVDCSVNHKRTPLFLEEPPPEKREEAVWSHIDRAFAEPATRSDDTADYAVTQVLAELFKAEGYDGIAYKSTFGEDGYNIAFFDITIAELLNCALFKVKNMEIEFDEDANPYFVTSKM
ncbi:RES family NAD+ phosphorylase (plasmid) [Aminobacter sp. BA135]|uniref:RES family NAD+ phosphorylase n=1 Tax=Aminobacter sp. BA135 TaxID=537596 RepID=UPI003D78D6A4